MLDARKGRVATRGWAEETDIDATDLARRFEDAGVAAIIYTDIDRDGAMQGPNVAATEALAHAVSIPVIASGGVSSLADLIALRDTGVIAGARYCCRPHTRSIPFLPSSSGVATTTSPRKRFVKGPPPAGPRSAIWP